LLPKLRCGAEEHLSRWSVVVADGIVVVEVLELAWEEATQFGPITPIETRGRPGGAEHHDGDIRVKTDHEVQEPVQHTGQGEHHEGHERADEASNASTKKSSLKPGTTNLGGQHPIYFRKLKETQFGQLTGVRKVTAEERGGKWSRRKAKKHGG
jgi:hypothetical protein